MFFGRIASLAMATAAVLGVFVEIPIVSDYAFWVLVGAYLLWLGTHRWRRHFKPLLMLSIVLILLAIVGLCVEIPIVSDYAFWVMAANYLIIVSATGSSYLIIVVN